MAEIDLTEAIEAGGKALWAFAQSELSEFEKETWDEADDEQRDNCREGVRVVLDAAAPLIEKAVREAVAREIEAYNATLNLGDDAFQDEGKWYVDKAAAIARGETL